MAESMFSNMYDARQKDLEGAVDYGASLAALPRGRVSVAVAGQSGGMLGQGLSSLAGALPPEQAQQAKIDELMSRFPNPTTVEEYTTIAGEAMTSGMQDVGEYFLKLADDMRGTAGKVSATQQQNLADMDATLAFLESSKGFKLNPEEAAYFKSRIKKDVSVTMGGQVVDTAPNVFDQIVSARKSVEASNGGIGDTGLTEAGLEKQVGDLATRVIKADLSGLDTAISQAEEMITSYKGKDIPGLSKMNVMERMTAEGSKNATRVKSVSNILMKLRSGAAVTESEAKRFSEEISSAPIVTDELWIDWLSRLRALVDERKRELYAGVPPEVIELYQSRQGKKKGTKELNQSQTDVLSKYGLK